MVSGTARGQLDRFVHLMWAKKKSRPNNSVLLFFLLEILFFIEFNRQAIGVGEEGEFPAG